MKTTRIGILAAAITGAAVALAGAAAADPAPGDYTGTMINGGGEYNEGGTAPFTLNSCGPDCLHLTQTGSGWDLHRQGNMWTGTSSKGAAAALDENTLVFTLDKGGNHVVIGLTKNG